MATVGSQVGGASPFKGATAGTNGSSGLVPAPVAGEQNEFLRGDGTWAAVGAATGYQTVDNNGVALPAQTTINFDGTELIATDNVGANRTDITLGKVSIAHGGTGATSFTAGSVVFVGAGGTSFAEDNANFNWNDATYTLSITQPSSLATLDSVLVVTSDPGGTHGHGNHIEIAGNPGGGGTIFRTDGGLNNSVLQLFGGDSTGTTGGALYLNGNNSTSGDAGGVQTTFGLPTSTFDIYDNTQSVLLFQVANSGTVTTKLGAGYVVSNGSGVLSIGATPATFTWNPVAGTAQTLAANNGYIANNAGLTTFTLPLTAAVGDTYKIIGVGAGGWTVAQNAGQTIDFNGVATTTGATGHMDSTGAKNTVEIVCTAANTNFEVFTTNAQLNLV